MGSSKNFKKVLSKTVASVYTAHTYSFAIRGYRKTVAPLYFADTYAHRHTQTFKKGLSNEGYAAHTPTPHKARCRFLMSQSKKK